MGVYGAGTINVTDIVMMGKAMDIIIVIVIYLYNWRVVCSG